MPIPSFITTGSPAGAPWSADSLAWQGIGDVTMSSPASFHLMPRYFIGPLAPGGRASLAVPGTGVGGQLLAVLFEARPAAVPYADAEYVPDSFDGASMLIKSTSTDPGWRIRCLFKA